MKTILTAILLMLANVTRASEPWKAGTTVSENEVAANGITAFFATDTISDEVFGRMYGKSVPHGKETLRQSLRYLRLIHHDGNGNILRGEMVCNKAIAAELLDIFRQLYEARYPIERMTLIDNYRADDEASMAANNTSAFCYRTVAGARRLSKHSAGMAVDINPLYNPCVKTGKDGQTTVQPVEARKWADRRLYSRYKITRNDLCYRLFIARGFKWGGDWKNTKDYQHFEK